MAGAGYKAFADGDVLTAAQVQTYLQDQAVMKFADSSARSAALGTAIVSEGMVTYLADTDAVEVYDGSAWTAVGKQGLTHLETVTFSSVASANFTDGIITASYPYYKVFVTLSASSTTQQVTYRLRDGGSALSAGSYQGGVGTFGSVNAALNVATTGATSFLTTWVGSTYPWYYSSEFTLMGNLRANNHRCLVGGMNNTQSYIYGGSGGFIYGSSATDTFDSFAIVVGGTISGEMHLYGVNI